VAQPTGVGKHQHPAAVTEQDAAQRQEVLDIPLDREVGIAEVIRAAEPQLRPSPGKGVQVDEPSMNWVPESLPDRSVAPVGDPADHERRQRGQIRRFRLPHHATPKCRAAATPERQPSSWNPQPW
jgi:hypothetical protein